MYVFHNYIQILFCWAVLNTELWGLPLKASLKRLYQSVNQYSNVFFSQIQIHQRDDLQFSFRSTMGEWKDFIFQFMKDMLIYGTYGISVKLVIAPCGVELVWFNWFSWTFDGF